jgi:periplasmic protein CpxP/Spy
MVSGWAADEPPPGKAEETMTDTNQNDEITTEPRPRPARSRRWLFLALPAVLLGGALGARAYAFGPGGPGDLSPEHMQRFIERRMDRVLDSIDATADQRARIKATFARLHPEMKALHEEKARLRDAGKKALAAEAIDAAEVERVRREVVKLADRGSSLVSRAVVEVGGILTPDQRKELLSHFEGHHRRWH